MEQSHAFSPENECKSINLQGILSYFPYSASREESKPQKNMIWMLIPSHNFHFVCFILGIVGPFESFFAFLHFSHNCSVSPAVTVGAATRVLNLLISVKVEWKHFQSRPVACRGGGGGGGVGLAFGPRQETPMTHLFLWQQAILFLKFNFIWWIYEELRGSGSSPSFSKKHEVAINCENHLFPLFSMSRLTWKFFITYLMGHWWHNNQSACILQWQ